MVSYLLSSLVLSDNFFYEFERIVNFIIDFIDLKCPSHIIDIDFNNEALIIYTVDGDFVLSKQDILQEIWLSSPVSGSHHFYKKNKLWTSSRNKRLLDVLEQDLRINFKI